MASRAPHVYCLPTHVPLSHPAPVPQSEVLTDDNIKALRQSVLTLCRTLEHVESIGSDVSLFTRDSTVQRNLRTLVQALSRMVDE